MTAPKHVMGASEWALLVMLSVVWGGAFFFYKVLGTALPPLTLVLGRVGIAAVALHLMLWFRRDPLRASPRVWGELILLGAINNALPFCCFAWSEIRITSGLAAILNATTPVFGILVGAALRTGAPLTPLRGLAVVFGFLGVLVLIGPAAFHTRDSGDLASELACLLASVSYAFAGYYGRRFAYLGPLKVAAGQTTGATIVLLPLAAAADRFWTLPPPGLAAWSALLAIALVSTAFAYMMYFRLLAKADPTDLMLVTFMVPISALVLGLLFLGEPVKPAAFGGMAMIGLSLVAIDGRIPARLMGLGKTAAATP